MRKGLLGNSNAALVIVSNTSPLIALKHVKVLHALGLLLKSVVVPPAVLAEFLVGKMWEKFKGSFAGSIGHS